MIRLSAIQLCSQPNVAKNLASIEKHIADLNSSFPETHQHIVVLPESCLYFGGKDKEQLALIEPEANKFIVSSLANLAQKYHIYLVAGTIPLPCKNANKFTASSLVFSPQGELLAEYQKMHLFDVFVEDNSGNYLESKYTQAGEKSVVTKLTDVSLGQSVCYDIRFPELFRESANLGADIITVPAAFTRVTGKAHWQVLLQARAIENQVYIIAAAQVGVHANGRETWGHSMIIDPWGNILSELVDGQGWVSAEFNKDKISDVRKNIPVLSHNRFQVMKNPV